jgi:hypothetical protein
VRGELGLDHRPDRGPELLVIRGEQGMQHGLENFRTG